jgi:hypothetical protein
LSRRPRCDGVIPADAQASSPSSQLASLLLPMHRRLAIVDDGDGATGNSINNNCDSATNVKNNGDGATDDDIDDNDCD